MKFRNLHDGFGAEVLGFDVMDGRAPEDVQALRQALDEYQLLLIRCGQRLPPERHVEICEWFGPPPPVDEDCDGKPWTFLDNEDKAGRIQLPFHSDFTYTDTPIKLISLHAIEIPRCGTSTSFVSGAHAWATLPQDRQDLLARMTVRHTHTAVVANEGLEFQADHPARLIHPRTGRPVLFVTEWHAKRIRDVEQEESDRLLAALFSHLYAPDNLYTHYWQVNDLIIWDNLAVQHARRDMADVADGPRVLQRVALNDMLYAELTERAKKDQRRRQLQET